MQISLRTLLVIVTIVAIVAGAWRWYEEPFRRQRQAMRIIEQVGGSYKTVAAAPAWLRGLLGEGRFQNIILVNVADCDSPDAYLDLVVSLPALETLVVGGTAFEDRHLKTTSGLEYPPLVSTRLDKRDEFRHRKFFADLRRTWRCTAASGE